MNRNRYSSLLVTRALLIVGMMAGGLTLFGAAAPTISIQGAPVRGGADAKVVVVEYSDFQCPYCGKFAREALPAIEDRYVKPGKIRYAFRHFPLDELHPKAFRAAEAAECANQQGKFWEMHDQLFAHQQALELTDFLSHAKALGVETAAFETCMKGAAKGRIKRDFNDGLKAGVEGTPTFLIGTAEKDGKVRVVKRLSGTQTTDGFTAVLDEVLAASGSGVTSPR